MEQYKSAKEPPPVVQYGSVVVKSRTQEAWPAGVMHRCFEAAGEILGPKPDDYYEEWAEWWKRAAAASD